MKFKGFFKSYWNLCKHSLTWLKDYWFATILIAILYVGLAIVLPCYLIDYIDNKKLEKETKQLKSEGIIIE